ncbi:MAG TPA: hypothetical protein VNE62_12315 [Actinomycetota bacterium]|nr:hypothetical protein [Actinomycetota bacterium]
MRGLIGTLAVAAVLFSAPVPAGAAPVSEYQYGGSSSSMCLYWYDYQGAEQGSIQLCGRIQRYGGYESRSVSASRSVRTCNASGQDCQDAYSETFSGPADAAEFSMDATAGTATFNIELSGENETCTVSATARATDTYSGSDPYPRVYAYGSPYRPYASVASGDTAVSASANPSPTYPSADLSRHESSSVSRAAIGSGIVCNWIETQSPGSGSMYFSSNQTTGYRVTPLSIP